MSVEPTLGELAAPDPQLSIETPEGVPVAFVLATPWERALAFGLDVFFSQLMTLVLVLVLVLAAVATTSEHIAALALIGFFGFRYVYFVFFEARHHGATPGKRILSLRVVRRDGGPLELEATLVRTILRELEVTLPVVLLAQPTEFLGPAPVWLTFLAVAWLLVVLLLPMLSKERVRAGDLVAGTVVVRVPKPVMRDDEALRESGGLAFQFNAKQLSHYGETELETLAELLRAIDQDRATAADLEKVAAAICKRIGVSFTMAQQDPERFLRDFYGAQREVLERELVLGNRIADKHERAARKK